MNFNATSAGRPGSRKVKRVSDVNAMGAPAPASSPYMQDPFAAQPAYPGAAPPQPNYPNPDYASYNASTTPVQPNHQQHQQAYTEFNAVPAPNNPPHQSHHQQQVPFNPMATPLMPGFGMFQQPIVQSMAMQYGQQLADQGKQMVESQFEKYIPVTRLKYYFAVDNNYVINKLRLLFFPFTHSNWSLRYDQDNPVQPRYDLNAPDLYIPTMAYITYVVLAGFILGLQQKFSPEDLGKMASTAFAVVLLELVIYSLALYITNIPSTLKSLDLLAYSGYKFTLMTTCILVGIVFSSFGYWVTFCYGGATFAFFMTRTLYTKLKSSNPQTDQAQPTYDAYGAPIQSHPTSHHDYNAARKRKLYFTGFMVAAQIVITWWLSRNLIAPSGVKLSSAL